MKQGYVSCAEKNGTPGTKYRNYGFIYVYISLVFLTLEFLSLSP